jgi:hypothetical protein
MANDAPTGGKAPDAPGRGGAASTDVPRNLEPMSPADAKQPPPLGPNRYEAVLPAVLPGTPGTGAPPRSAPVRRVAHPPETPPITDAFWADGDVPLGDKFAPGVYDPHNTLQGKRPGIARKELAIAQLEADGGAAVHFRRDSTVEGERHPDVRTRRGPSDRARVTEYKTMESGTQRAVYRSIHSARENLRGEPGDAVIDGRAVRLTRETADAGYDQAERVPEDVYFYLGDGTVHQRTRKF